MSPADNPYGAQMLPVLTGFFDGRQQEGARSPSGERLRSADAPQDRRRPSLGAGVSSSPQDGGTHHWWGCYSWPSVTACEGDSDDLVSPPPPLPPDLPLLPLALLIRFQVFSFSTAATGVCVAHFTRGLQFAMQR